MTSPTALARLGRGLLVGVLMVACGGTSANDLLAAESEWSSAGIDDYTLWLQIICYCGLAGSYDITVQDGHVTEIMSDGAVIEAPGGVTPSDWFTVEGLFDIIKENLHADRVHVSYGENGYPTSIEIDHGEADDYLQITTALQVG